jgi:hypothetical protein
VGGSARAKQQTVTMLHHRIQSKPQCHFCGAFLAAVGVAVLLVSCSPSVKAPRKSTEIRLKNVERAIRLLEEANHATIAEQLRGISGGTTLQDKWELLLVDDAGKLEMESNNIREVLCRDAWGNRFNLDFKTNLVASGASAALLNSTFDLIVWSSGPNGSNEFGNGDDVVFPSPVASK